MIRLLIPVLLAAAFAWAMMRFSLWQTRRKLEAEAVPLRDPALEAQAARLARALGLDRVEVRILPTEVVNGLADADGRIYLTRGFLTRRARGEVTDEELASVIAHELGHVAQGHMKRRMIDVTGQNTVLMAVSGLLHRVLPYVGPWLARHALSALMAGLSRRDEFEADAWASALLIKAGIGTAPQKALFQKLDRLSGNAGADSPAWLRSHPTAADRIAAIERNEARWLAGPKPD